MKYRKFIVSNYRAISGPLVIDVSKNVLIPIIGINECGKTTILQAIFAFDHCNDELNDNGRHRRDTDNLYATNPKPAIVSAEVDVPRYDLRAKLSHITQPSLKYAAEGYKKKRGVPTTFTISRNIKSGVYDIDVPSFQNKELNNILARSLINGLPYTLYFDDFRDSVEEKVEIIRDGDGDASGWLGMFEQLFKQTDRKFSVFALEGMEDRQRKTVLSAVKRKLNETLTKEWHKFRLDSGDALQISLDFYTEVAGGAAKRNYLRLDVIEKDSDGNEHFFFINDRSKGFFWFFNFVMKLEFNPKVFEYSQTNAIYLLDEPGSYLHASAQSKLCTKLRQLSQNNAVIYCTHSHYLLDPNTIPLSSIRVAEKSSNGEVRLLSIHEHKGDMIERRSAFQPVVDALQIKPFLLDLTSSFVVLVEGISDFYALEMFKGNRAINILPSVGADSILYYISLMIAWRIEYRALWDNDAAGVKSKAKADDKFGELESSGRFFSLPGNRPRILQNLFEGSDLAMIRDRLGVSTETSFDKTMAMLFYSPIRTEILNDISVPTRAQFEMLFAALKLI